MSDSTGTKSGEFKPRNLTPGGVEIRPFKPKSLHGEVLHDYQEVKEKFGSLASTDPDSKANFNLHSASKKLLGIEREEKNYVESIVSEEVESRIQQLKDQAYQDGFQQGQAEGRKLAEEKFHEETKPLFEQFTALLESFDQVKREMYLANETFLIQMIYQIGKQVLLKELAVDPEYVKRVTSHLIEKLGAKDNIRIRISRKDQENVEQLREFLKAQYPDLKNVQIEASDDLALGGCKIETDLSRLNASVETQLKAIETALGET